MLSQMNVKGMNEGVVVATMEKAPQMLEYLNGLVSSLPNPVAGPKNAKTLFYLMMFAKGESFVLYACFRKHATNDPSLEVN